MESLDFATLVKKTSEVGFVEEVRDCLVYASGLPSVRVGELVTFETGSVGQVTAFAEEKLEILLFDKDAISIGSQVARTNQFLEINVSQALMGRVITPLGQPLDGLGPVSGKNLSSRPLEVTPTGISGRTRIDETLETGVALVDILVPLGKGQRELIVGDRKTGKTSFLRQSATNQAKKGTVCIYAAIGKKTIDIKGLQEHFLSEKVMDNIIIVASGSSDSPGLIFLTPYAAMAIAEYFRDLGLDSLIILDDLTTHAKFYREISLVGDRFPGRESYPGDIFYLHSKLLERAGNFKTSYGNRSISCLPVAESLEGDISGYIQTNLMSMTDGHIFFDNDLFVKGQRPAINPFLSVTRVGNQTQSQVRKDIRREITVVLNLYERSEELSHFGSSLLETMKLSLITGKKILDFFDQGLGFLIPEDVQVVVFSLLWLNYWPENQSLQMKKDAEILVKKYHEDKEFQVLMTDLLTQSKTFNEFLGKFQTNIDKIKNYLHS